METLFDNGVTVKRFTKFVVPSVVMFVFIGMYYTIDGIFVANFVGSNAFAAMGIVYPIQGIVWGMSVMLASGSSAIVAMKMGEGNQKEANEKFSMICIFSGIMGLVVIVLCILFLEPMVDFLGATPALKEYCMDYAGIVLLATPAAFLGVLFEYFIRVDGKPGFTLLLYVSGGIVNIVLDYIFIVVFGWGLKGAALATATGMIVVMILGGYYFIFKETKLKFVWPKRDFKYLGHCMGNGSSEMVSESSVGITTFFFNMIMIKLAGENGVAALNMVLNVHYILVSVHLGYVTGVAPLISYHYGAQDYAKVNKFIRYSRNYIGIASGLIAILCFIGAPFIADVFAARGSEVHDMGMQGLRILSVALLFTGVNIFASGFFTAYGNGPVSAVISLSRSLVLVIAGVFVLSYFFGINGIWMTIVMAEVGTLAITAVMFARYKKVYKYKL